MTPRPVHLPDGDQPHVELRGLDKRYSGVRALADVDLRIMRGTIHGLIGENGAGKSTAAKIIGGAIQPDGGEVRVLGEPVRFGSPKDALRHGVALILQELSLVPDMAVADNVFLGLEPMRWRTVDRRELKRRFALLDGFDVDPDIPVRELSIADQQKVEIMRAIARDAELILMDEPTSSLTADEAERLHQMVRQLRDRGTTIVYVSHDLGHVLALADTVTVMRNGRVVRTAPSANETPDSLVTAMLGQPQGLSFPPRQPVRPDADVVLDVRGLTVDGACGDIDLHVRHGEILGLAGLVGSGRSEVAHAIFGATRRDAGEIAFLGQPQDRGGLRQAIARGMGLVPESRKEQGLLMDRTVGENLTLPSLGLRRWRLTGGLSARREREEADGLLQQLAVRPASPTTPIHTLSGGNQQKVLLGKWLMTSPRLLILDEPTRGVDVGARAAIHELVVGLARAGTAVILISSDFEEVLGLAHRILVMHEGRAVATLDAGHVEHAELVRAALGLELQPRTGVPQADGSPN
jgi:ABC-type sugar transport system ATPase subunit